MTATTINAIVCSGTNAERLAYTPSLATPASGPDPSVIFKETDTGNTFMWDFGGASWQQVNGGLADADYGDISISSGVWSIDNNAVTDAKLRDSAALSVIGRSANSTGDPADIAAGSDGQVLRRSGTSLDFGTVATAGIADDAVTYAKMQNVSATDKLLGRSTAGAGDVEEITCTAAGRALLDDADAAAQRATMGCNRLLFGITIDGGGSVITTGVKGFVRIPVAHTITKATALSSDSAATSGSIVVDVWRDTYANYPPTDLDSITSSAPVTISSATKSEDSTLTGWNKTGSAGDIYGFNVDSVTSLTKVIIEIEATY